MLAALGFTSIIFTIVLFPAEQDVAIGDFFTVNFFTVKLPAILISGVIGYLLVKLRKLEEDRKHPIMGMTPTLDAPLTSEHDSHVQGTRKAYFGVVFDKKYSEPFNDEELNAMLKK